MFLTGFCAKIVFDIEHLLFNCGHSLDNSQISTIFA